MTLSIIEKKAKKGDPEAQCALGIGYLEGRGVKQDFVQAAAWLEKAATQGIARAQYFLGTVYQLGKGVEQDNVQAAAWLEKAAVQGHAEAQWGLGVYYIIGEGVEQDLVQAAAWFEKAAVLGFAQAQNSLGLCYSEGKGVEQDHVQAVAWFEKAAAQGHVEAQEVLVKSADLPKTAQNDALGRNSNILDFPNKANADEIFHNQASQLLSSISGEQLFELIKPQLTAFAEEQKNLFIQDIRSQVMAGIVSSENTSDILVSQEESLTHEYKASLRIPCPNWPEQETDEKGNSFFKSGGKTYRSRKELLRDLEESCLKTIVAFLNTKGGTLVIGVHDKDDEKTIVGIEREIGSKQDFLRSKDKYQLHLIQQINERIGTTFTSNYISVELPVIDGSTLCVVRCQEFRPAQNHGPAFLDDEKAYRRTGNRTDEVKGGKAISDFTLERQNISG